MMIPTTISKLLDYALCASANDGEAANAFTRARPLLHRAGIDSAAKLAAAIGLPAPECAGDIGEHTHFPFGKHKGESVSDVWRDDPSYCRWFRSSIAPDGYHADAIAAARDAIDALIDRGSR